MTTPLVTLSEYKSKSLSLLTGAPNDARLRDYIRAASELLQKSCDDRRFDHFVESRSFDAFPIDQGGDILDFTDLILDYDLVELKGLYYQVSDDDPVGIEITENFSLLPRDTYLGLHAYRRIRLNPFKGEAHWSDQEIWSGGGVDPADSIRVNGVWGYGVSYWPTGATLTNALNDTADSFDVTGPTFLEIDMVIQIDSELMIVTGISGDTVTVERGYNGFTKAAHDAAATIKRHHALDLLKSQCIRLVQFTLAQHESPLYGQTVVAGQVAPVIVSALPADVEKALITAGFKRPALWGVI